jgi:hypothetical protein
VLKTWIEKNCRFAAGPVPVEPLDPRQIAEQIKGSGESLNLLGSNDVEITGDKKPTITLRGQDQTLTLSIEQTVTDVINTIKSSLHDSDRLAADPDLLQWKNVFDYINKVVVGNFGTGEFGHAMSREPYTIYVNWDRMIQMMQEAVDSEINKFAAEYGVLPEFTDDAVERVKLKIAEQLGIWLKRTIPHETRHARDFQDILANMMTTGEGDLGQATEERAEREELAQSRRLTKKAEFGSSWKGQSGEGHEVILVHSPSDTMYVTPGQKRVPVPKGFYLVQDVNNDEEAFAVHPNTIHGNFTIGESAAGTEIPGEVVEQTGSGAGAGAYGQEWQRGRGANPANRPQGQGQMPSVEEMLAAWQREQQQQQTT